MEVRDKHGLTEQEFLAAYRPKDYPRPSLTADIAVFSCVADTVRVLLVRRGGHPYLGKWALPGGFAQPGETVTDTARRELAEETGILGLCLAPVGLFSEPGRDPRMWVVSQAFAALIPPERMPEASAGDDAAEAQWFSVRTERCKDGIRLHLAHGADAFTACLTRTVPPDCTEPQYRAEDSGGLAFDHAQILCRAMETLGLL